MNHETAAYGLWGIASYVLIGSGFWLTAAAWRVLYQAQKTGTLAMYPVLVYMYVRLAKREEQEAHATFGAEYERYARLVPAFLPRIGTQTDKPR